MNDVRRPSPIAPAAHYIHVRILFLGATSVHALIPRGRFAVMILMTHAVVTRASPGLVTVV